MVKSIILIIVIGLAIFFSGCTGDQDVTSVVKALPEIQQFMNEHPNAKITVTYWSKEEVTQTIQEISKQCEKPIIPIAMYKAIVSEENLKIISWINAENQIAICSTTEGSGEPILREEIPESVTQPKIINLHSQQIILTETELKEIVGTDITKKEQKIIPENEQRGIHLLSGISVTYGNPNVTIILQVSPTTDEADKLYQSFGAELQKSIKVIGNKIDIGDKSELYSVVGVQNGTMTLNEGLSVSSIIFRKNNIVVLIATTTDVKIETLINLSKKQEEKISKLLDIISTTQGSGSPQISTSTPIQTYFSTEAPTVSVVASNNPDTQVISSNIVVEQVLGDRTTSINPTLDDILIRIKPDVDTTSIDLRQVNVTVMDNTIRTVLNYSNTASDLTYTAIAVRDEDGSFSPTTPVLDSGDLIEIQISSNAIKGISLAPRKTFWLSLNQELGQVVNLEIATPNSFGVNRYVRLYP